MQIKRRFGRKTWGVPVVGILLILAWAGIVAWKHIEIGAVWTILVAVGIVILSLPVSFRLSRAPGSTNS